MSQTRINASAELLDDEWVTFPGGELEGRRPRAMCPSCRDALKRAALSGTRGTAAGNASVRRPLCFQCYRADLERDRAFRAAAEVDTTSNQRLQFQLPLEPVDHARLGRLKAERAAARSNMPDYVTRRRHAQIEARHALREIASGLRARGLSAGDRERAIFEAVHAAELQLPEAWLPFVVAR